MLQPDLSVIIVSYNVAWYLANCLGSLPAGCDGLDVEIFVVDNASRDGSAAIVARRFPEVRLLVNAENFGFAKAVNRAAGLARGRYILLLNPDTIVPAGALARLVEVAERTPEAGLVGPVLRDPVTGALQSSFRPFPSWRTIFSHHTVAKFVLRRWRAPEWHAVIDQPTTAGWLSGACLLVRRDLFSSVGALDEGYFMWFEDIDYCRRAIRAGWPVLYTHKTSIFHYEGRSAEQEMPAAVWLEELQSALHYLDGDRSHASRLLKQLFKVLLLGTVLSRVVTSSAKIVWHRARRGADISKYRWRLERDTQFLSGYAGKFLRL